MKFAFGFIHKDYANHKISYFLYSFHFVLFYTTEEPVYPAKQDPGCVIWTHAASNTSHTQYRTQAGDRVQGLTPCDTPNISNNPAAQPGNYKHFISLGNKEADISVLEINPIRREF